MPVERSCFAPHSKDCRQHIGCCFVWPLATQWRLKPRFAPLEVGSQPIRPSKLFFTWLATSVTLDLLLNQLPAGEHAWHVRLATDHPTTMSTLIESKGTQPWLLHSEIGCR